MVKGMGNKIVQGKDDGLSPPQKKRIRIHNLSTYKNYKKGKIEVAPTGPRHMLLVP